MDVRVELKRKLRAEELMLLNCGVGEDSWESVGLPGDQPVNPKGDRSWVFIGRIDVEAEIPILWPSDAKNWLIGKDPDAGKDWMWEEKGMTEDEMIGWHHWLNGHEFEQALGVGDGWGSLMYYSPWGRKDLGTTEWLNWTERFLEGCRKPKSSIGFLEEGTCVAGDRGRMGACHCALLCCLDWMCCLFKTVVKRTMLIQNPLKKRTS